MDYIVHAVAESERTEQLSLSLVLQWLRLCLLMQEVWVRALVRELRSPSLMAKKPKHRAEAIL